MDLRKAWLQSESNTVANNANPFVAEVSEWFHIAVSSRNGVHCPVKTVNGINTA